MAGLRTSLAFSFATRYSDVAIHTISVVVLARLLTPEELGLYAIGAALMAIGSVVGDFAVEPYLVQAPRLRRLERQTAVGLTLITGWTVGIAFLLARGTVAEFYGEPELASVLLVMSATFFFVPLNLPILAMLRRQMMFGALYFVMFVGKLAFALTAIALATWGFGAMSMAWATLMQIVAMTFATMRYYTVAPPCRPGFRAWRPIAAFGLTATTTLAIHRAGMTAPALFVGRMLGIEATGLFSRAQGIAQLFYDVLLKAVEPVALPVLAGHLRDGRDLKAPYLVKTEYVSAIVWPCYAFVALMAEPLVRVVLGPQWGGVVPIIRILCLTGLMLPFSTINGEFFVALGKQGRLLRIEAALFPLLIALIALGSLHSVEAVALAIVIGRAANALASNLYLSRELGYTAGEAIHAARKSLLILGASAVAPAAIWYGTIPASLGTIPALALATAGAAVGWLSAAFATHHPLAGEVVHLGRRAQAVLRTVWHRYSADDRAPPSAARQPAKH